METNSYLNEFGSYFKKARTERHLTHPFLQRIWGECRSLAGNKKGLH